MRIVSSKGEEFKSLMSAAMDMLDYDMMREVVTYQQVEVYMGGDRVTDVTDKVRHFMNTYVKE